MHCDKACADATLHKILFWLRRNNLQIVCYLSLVLSMTFVQVPVILTCNKNVGLQHCNGAWSLFGVLAGSWHYKSTSSNHRNQLWVEKSQICNKISNIKHKDGAVPLLVIRQWVKEVVFSSSDHKGRHKLLQDHERTADRLLVSVTVMNLP